MALDYIASLKDEITFLREQLDHSRRVLAAERERSDVIQQLALQRIPPLAFGPSHRGQDEGRADDVQNLHSDHPTGSPDAPGATEPPREGSDTSHASKPWWRRLFGGTA